jgi:hypothetical protein
MPYLYYYSPQLGGIIIERADGTDSHHIGADVIPPGAGGIAGPGWSPSGHFFAAHTITDTLSGPLTGEPFIIDITGKRFGTWLELTSKTNFMQWSPDGADILLIVAGYFSDRPPDVGTFFWLFDIENNVILADFGANIEDVTTGVSEITWEHERIIFYIQVTAGNFYQYYRVTMHFDGTTLREVISDEEFAEHYSDPLVVRFSNYLEEYAASPSGRYEARGAFQPTLTDTTTGETIELPHSTRATTCATFLWSEDEQYILSAAGTVVAGGGCGAAILGVTDSKGNLWRELGICSWDFPPCVGWLPERVIAAINEQP